MPKNPEHIVVCNRASAIYVMTLQGQVVARTLLSIAQLLVQFRLYLMRYYLLVLLCHGCCFSFEIFAKIIRTSMSIIYGYIPWMLTTIKMQAGCKKFVVWKTRRWWLCRCYCFSERRLDILCWWRSVISFTSKNLLVFGKLVSHEQKYFWHILSPHRFCSFCKVNVIEFP